MENVSIHAAALKAIEWFDLDPEAMSASAEKEEPEKPSEPQSTGSCSQSRLAKKAGTSSRKRRAQHAA